MITLSGKRVYPPGHPEYNLEAYPTLHDIGVSLGRIPRWCGQVNEWYPVLLHTFVVADLVSTTARPHALLHDATEACMNDTPTPWKTTQAKRWEDDLLAKISHANGIIWTEDVIAEVRRADRIALCAEALSLGYSEPTLILRESFPNLVLDPEDFNEQDKEDMMALEQAVADTKRWLGRSPRDYLIASYAGSQYELEVNRALEMTECEA